MELWRKNKIDINVNLQIDRTAKVLYLANQPTRDKATMPSATIAAHIGKKCCTFEAAALAALRHPGESP
ncbi:MAG: hypothetical protein WDN06_11945 [Asticcacaulis sp.]